MSGRLELERAPYATATWPGCGGAFKTVPEDFEVEEVPAYEPSGKGEHLFLWVEKRGVSTPEVASTLAQAVGLPEREVGYAGLKDKQGVTRQFFSIPARHEDRVGLFVLPGAQVLWGKRHGNKLRTGHLYGNRFVLRLRGVERPEAARAAFGALEEGGVPNFFGAQRFGAADTNAAAGKALILGQRLPARPSRFERKLFLSAYQSLLFNRALARRMEAGTWSQALPGDVMRKLPEGGVFRCDSPELDQPRVAAFEVSPAGPLFGPKMFEAADPVRAAEAALLVEEKVSLEDFRRGGDETEGGRRP
ncbi:MAG TPA: tRNA pseudouridine(13) synthase TruD, partial [Myxococcaceae bacterium]|nr:tRNA pseudouridine(13) synthase TruD [Myxococcaceae bacterium]